MYLLPIPYEFIKKNFDLSWGDVLWGYERSMIGWPSVVAMANDRLSGELGNNLVRDLSMVGKSNVYLVGEILRTLASDRSDGADITSKKKWLFLNLSWLYDNRNQLSDPLGEVECIYADFDYPQDISKFVRYMPTQDDSVKFRSVEENNNRLYGYWKEYITENRKLIIGKSEK